MSSPVAAALAASASRGVFVPVALVELLGPGKALVYQQLRWLIHECRHEVEHDEYLGGLWAKVTVDELSEWTGMPRDTVKRLRRELVAAGLLLVTQDLGAVDDRSSWFALAGPDGQPMGSIRSHGGINLIRSSSDQSDPFFLITDTGETTTRRSRGSDVDNDSRFVPGAGNVPLVTASPGTAERTPMPAELKQRRTQRREAL